MFRDLKHFIGKHFVCLICSLLYLILGGFLLGGTIYSFAIALFFYIVSVMVAFSPLGEKLFRYMSGIRSLETKQEKDYLNPIFKDVQRSIKRLGKPTKRRIEICVIDKMEVNACAVGRNTIAVTKGAMKFFTEEQLKGVIAHEMGHIGADDSKANIFLLIGSGYLYLFILLANLFILLADKITTVTGDKSIGKFLCSVFKAITNIFMFLFTFPMKIALAIESRKKEYRADRTAYKLGYGEDLISALYLLEKLNLGDNRDFMQKMTASHPRTTARIEQLESYVEQKEPIAKENNPSRARPKREIESTDDLIDGDRPKKKQVHKTGITEDLVDGDLIREKR